tara:strand:+ start:396 stop:857 length:462 start_codon:yes stop_codon:yes gene_type:complete
VREFSWGLRVYYEDTDLAGIVYYANYLRYMERARTEWLRAVGCEQDELLATSGVVFVVVRASLEYKSPSRFNDVLVVDVDVTSLGRASVVVRQEIHRAVSSIEPGVIPEAMRAGGAVAEQVCIGEIRIACVDAKTLYPRPIPQFIYSELSREC